VRRRRGLFRHTVDECTTRPAMLRLYE